VRPRKKGERQEVHSEGSGQGVTQRQSVESIAYQGDEIALKRIRKKGSKGKKKPSRSLRTMANLPGLGRKNFKGTYLHQGRNNHTKDMEKVLEDRKASLNLEKNVVQKGESKDVRKENAGKELWQGERLVRD